MRMGRPQEVRKSLSVQLNVVQEPALTCQESLIFDPQDRFADGVDSHGLESMNCPPYPLRGGGTIEFRDPLS